MTPSFQNLFVHKLCTCTICEDEQFRRPLFASTLAHSCVCRLHLINHTKDYDYCLILFLVFFVCMCALHIVVFFFPPFRLELHFVLSMHTGTLWLCRRRYARPRLDRPPSSCCLSSVATTGRRWELSAKMAAAKRTAS